MVDLFKQKLIEGFCYRVENFEVQENWGQLRATHHGFRVFFKATTEVVRTNGDIPVNGFQCIPFLEILHRQVPLTYLVGMWFSLDYNLQVHCSLINFKLVQIDKDVYLITLYYP